MIVNAELALIAIGFFVGAIIPLIFLPKDNIKTLLFGMFFFGIIGVFAAPWVLTAINKTRWSIEDHNRKETAITEYEYFMDIIAGRVKPSEFTDHYRRNDISWMGVNKIIGDDSLLNIIEKSSLSTTDLIKLVDAISRYPVIVSRLAFSNKLPGEYYHMLLMKLVEPIEDRDHNKYYEHLKFLAQNENTPKEILLMFAVRSQSVYMNAACDNRNAPEIAKSVCAIRNYPWMSKVEREKSPFPRDSYENPNYRDAWVALATDALERVRIVVARHSEAPHEVLDMLAHDESADVLCWALMNDNISDMTREKIAKFTGMSNDEYLRMHASNYNDNFKLREAIAKYPRLSQKTIAVSANDDSYDIREIVAQRPDLSEALCVKLSLDNVFSVRREIAQRHDLTKTLCFKLSSDNDVWVRKLIASNPICSQQRSAGKP